MLFLPLIALVGGVSRRAVMNTELVLWSLGTGIASALATGLGAIVALAITEKRFAGFANAVAAGMMIAASVFALAQEGIALEASQVVGVISVVVGMLAGAGFLWFVSKRTEDLEEEAQQTLKMSRRSLLLFLALFVHSVPEGVAIGVGFATGDVSFGIAMALAIAIHNVPEGVAMSLPMRAEGASLAKCVTVSVLTSLPQPLLAVPAAVAFDLFKPGLPIGLGFAAGAMMYIVIDELLPEALSETDHSSVAWGVMLGLCGMLIVSILL